MTSKTISPPPDPDPVEDVPVKEPPPRDDDDGEDAPFVWRGHFRSMMDHPAHPLHHLRNAL